MSTYSNYHNRVPLAPHYIENYVVKFVKPLTPLLILAVRRTRVTFHLSKIVKPTRADIFSGFFLTRSEKSALSVEGETNGWPEVSALIG